MPTCCVRDEAVSTTAQEVPRSASELLVDDEIAVFDEDAAAARVGGSADSPSNEDGAVRGLVLRVTGEGARAIAHDRAAK